MPTLPSENQQQYSPANSAQAIGTLIGDLKDADVTEAFFENEDQTEAVFATTDPALVLYLKAIFEENAMLTDC